MKNISVRKAEPGDANVAAAIVRRSIEALCDQDHRGDEQLMRAWLANKTEDNFRAWIAASLSSFLACGADAAHGFALVTAEGELALLYVTPDLLHQGAGKALLQACEQAMRKAGLHSIKLDSTQTARKFYQRNGFDEMGPPQEGWGMISYPMIKQV